MTEEKRRRSPRINYIKRSEYWKGKMYQRGVEQAKLEAHRKKPLEESAREHLGKFLDNLSGSSGVDVAIYASLAYLSYENVVKQVHHDAVKYDYQTQAEKDSALAYILGEYSNSQALQQAILQAQTAIDQCEANNPTHLPDACNYERMRYNELQKRWANYVQTSTNATVGTNKEAYDTVEHFPEAALIGPVALKLACSMGGTPPVAQIAGLAILAGLGIASVGGIPELEKVLFPISPQSLGPTASPPLVF